MCLPAVSLDNGIYTRVKIIGKGFGWAVRVAFDIRMGPPHESCGDNQVPRPRHLPPEVLRRTGDKRLDRGGRFERFNR
jgi:hypothetical protein